MLQLLSLFGMCLMAMAVLVSLAVVSMNDSITSPDQLHMFSPLMLISIGLIMGKSCGPALIVARSLWV